MPFLRSFRFAYSMLAAFPLSFAGEDLPKDEWHLQMLGEAKIGYEHQLVEAVNEANEALFKTTTEGHVSLNRLGSPIEIVTMSWTLEDAKGAIRSMYSEMKFSTNATIQELRVLGTEAELTTRTVGRPTTTKIPWNAAYLGPRAREQQMKNEIAAGKTSLTYDDYNLELGPCAVEVKVLGKETVKIPAGGSRELLHVKTSIVNNPIVMDSYYDEKIEMQLGVMRQMGMEFFTIPSTKSQCLAVIENPDLPELFSRFSPQSNVRLPDPYLLDEVLYRIRAKDAELGFPQMEDRRQAITRKISDLEAELTIRKIICEEHASLPIANPTEEEKKCLASSAFLQCDDQDLVSIAKAAASKETDVWKAAQRLERFANKYIDKKGFGTGFASALEVLKNREGDCTEHGVFLAALCRAVGIPARVAIGLVYYNGIFGGHMWTEVSVLGKWYALDATLGNGFAGATHLCFATDDLESTQIQSAFANMGRSMGNLEIEVLSFRRGDRRVVVGKDFLDHEIRDGRYRNLLLDFSLACPEGYELKPNHQIGLNDLSVLRIEKPGHEKDVIELSVQSVPFEFEIEDASRSVESTGAKVMASEATKIDERPALLIRWKRDSDGEHRMAAALRGQTLFRISTSIDEPADDLTFDQLLKSLDLDG